MKTMNLFVPQCRLVLLAATLLGSAVAAAADWPVYRGPNHNGISAETGWNRNFADPKPDILWRAQVGVGFSLFTVSDGKAYTTGNVSDTDVIHCFDAATGKVLWRHRHPEPKDPKYYEGGTSASVTIHNGKAYTLSKTGDALCLDAATGSVLWQKDLKAEYGYEPPTWGFAGSPFIWNDSVVLNVGSSGIALHKDSGALVWKSPAGESGYSTPVPFTHDGTTVLLLFSKESLIAVDPDTGTVRWTYPWKTKYDVNAADPIIRGNRIFISSGYNHGGSVIEVNGTKVKQLWKNRQMRNQLSTCVLLDDYLYGFDETTLKCLSFETGQPAWEQDGLGKGTLMLADGTLIVLSEAGKLVTAPATPSGFEPISQAEILSGARCWSMPVLANGRIFARNANGDAVCVNVQPAGQTRTPTAGKPAATANWCRWRGPDRDGVSKETGLLKQWPQAGPPMAWSFEGLGKGHASPSVCDGVLYVTGTVDKTGFLYAFDLDGKLRWKTAYGEEWVRSFPGSRSTPTISDGKVYLITGNGVVVCCDAADGRTVWSKNMHEHYDGKHNRWGYGVAPLVYDDTLIFAPGGDQTTVVALNKHDGTVLWESESTGEKNAYCPPLVFEHAGRQMLVTMMSEAVWFLDAQTGQVLYRDPFADYQDKVKGINPNTPIYHNGNVFTTSGYDNGSAMYAISDDGSRFSRKWVNADLDTHHGGTILLDGKIYGANWKGNNNGDWLCLDWDTGKVLSAQHWENKGSITAADGMLYLYEEKNGHLALARPTADGFEIVSRFAVPLGTDQHWAHPVVCGGRLYVRHGDALMAYNICSL